MAKEVKEKKTTKATKSKEEVKVVETEKTTKKNLSLSAYDQKEMKDMSTVVYIISKIFKIFASILIPFVVIALIFMPVLADGVEIKDNTFYVFDKDTKVSFVENEDKTYTVIVPEDGKGNKTEETLSYEETQFFKNMVNNKTTYIILVEVLLVALIAMIYIDRKAFKELELLFKDIKNEATPFTHDNSKRLLHASKLMLISVCIAILSGLVGSSVTKGDLVFDVNLMQILMIGMNYVFAHIIEYGARLQEQVKSSIYSE